jgi:serine protease Do
MKRNFMGGNPRQFFAPEDGFTFNNTYNNNAFLGVLSAKTDKGAIIKKVIDSSSAKRSGLEKDDIITKVNDKKITSPEDLRSAIQSYQPGSKVTINYLRDGKKKSVKVDLGKTPENFQSIINTQGLRNLMNRFGNGNNYQFNMPEISPRDFNFHNNRARLGLKIQDTPDSSGVKIQNVISGSPADKAGLQEGDIITQMNGSKVNNVNNVMSEIHNSDNKNDYKIKVLRDKNEMNFDVHILRPLRTTNI